MKKTWLKVGLFATLGAIAGYAYYYYIGCYNGSCMISSNPYISTGYGFVAGLVLSWNGKSKQKKDKSED